jgi:multiple sugar transport system ATP-binding protein
VQQLDTPRNVYENPVNLFVAGFIGSHSMNVVPVRVVKSGQNNCLLVKTSEKTFTIPVGKNPLLLNKWIDRELILGFRPEQISDGFPDQAGNNQIHTIESKVEVIEPTGPDTLVFIRINHKKVACRVHPNAARRPGETMKLMLDLSAAIFFDPDTEEQIS